MMRKILIFSLFLIVFYLISPSAIWAQGTCTAKKNVAAQTCELDTNNCQTHYTPQVIEKEGSIGTVACSCQCVPDPNNPPPQPSDACIETAIGPVCGLDNPANFVSWFLKFALGLAGGIAFILIILGGFQILMSSGEPEKIKAGQELITSAIAGLLLIVFSVFILRIIGVEVLKIFPK